MFVTKFIDKTIFTRLGTARVILWGEDTHFCNKMFENV